MYRLPKKQLSFLDDFYIPFSGKFRADNRWVQLAIIIPWEAIEQKYSTLFAEGQGAPAKSVRMAFGALIIKEKCGYSVRETVEQIRENPYLQYFIDSKEYPFILSDEICGLTKVSFRKGRIKDSRGSINSHDKGFEYVYD